MIQTDEKPHLESSGIAQLDCFHSQACSNMFQPVEFLD